MCIRRLVIIWRYLIITGMIIISVNYFELEAYNRYYCLLPAVMELKRL